MSIKWNMIATPLKGATRRRAALLTVLALGLAAAEPLWLQAQDRPDSGTPVTAVGIGRPPADASPTQARAMAERSAFLNAIREAASKSGRTAPYEYQGAIRQGMVVKGFRITRLTRRPDGSVEIEVSVPPAGVTPH